MEINTISKIKRKIFLFFAASNLINYSLKCARQLLSRLMVIISWPLMAVAYLQQDRGRNCGAENKSINHAVYSINYYICTLTNGRPSFCIVVAVSLIKLGLPID